MEQNRTSTCGIAEKLSRRPAEGWSEAAVDSLRRHWNDGLTTAEIASRLGKSVRAVECKIYKLRARGCVLAIRRRDKSGHDDDGGFHRATRVDRPARRRCLYCGEDFDSSHRGNRICPGCLEDGPFTSAMV